MSEQQFFDNQNDPEEMDMPMEESDPEDLDDDDGDDDDDDDEMQDEEEAPAPPEPVEEEAAVARRRAIQAIMRDTSLSEQEKRTRIQSIMSGGRTAVAPAPAPVLPQPEANAACVHYERNCNIVAPCCQRVFGCRICHDELSPAGHPPMNRFLVREVVCKNCQTRQNASYVDKTVCTPLIDAHRDEPTDLLLVSLDPTEISA